MFDKDVAKALHLSPESFSHFKKRGTVPLEQIIYFCGKRNISINWVLLDQLPKSLEEETEKYTKIKYFSKINASAGGGGFNDDEAYEMLLIDTVFLDALYRSKKANLHTIAAMNVTGDSMESTLQDQEIILFDLEEKEIAKGGIFIVSTNAGLFVKRVRSRADGTIELMSDNPSFSSEMIPANEQSTFQVVGKVVGKVGVV